SANETCSHESPPVPGPHIRDCINLGKHIVCRCGGHKQRNPLSHSHQPDTLPGSCHCAVGEWPVDNQPGQCAFKNCAMASSNGTEPEYEVPRTTATIRASATYHVSSALRWLICSFNVHKS